jgi:Sulfotransferase domain
MSAWGGASLNEAGTGGSARLLPNLIVIGGQKCGTTSLHNYLAAHPQIAMSATKELDFFTSWGRRRGLDWYGRHFTEPAPVRGESSPAYTAWPHILGVPEAIAETLDDVRLIYLVRDPVERIVSEYLHAVGRGQESRTLAEVASDPGFEDSPYVAKSRYAMQLERYLRLFDRSRLLVLTQESLSRERLATMRTVFRFLGVNESFVSPRFARRYNKARDWRAGSGLVRRARAALGEQRFERLSERVPRPARRLGDRMLRRPIEVPELPDELHRRLVDLLAPDTARLAGLTGLDLGRWSTATPASAVAPEVAGVNN